MTMNTLNAEQLAVVRHSDGPMRVIAGAGTGKTQALTHRFTHLVERGIREDRILCLTFSRKAARELRDRILEDFPHGSRTLHIHTFHAFCLSLIQEWRLEARLTKAPVLSDQEMSAFIAEVVKAIPDGELHAYSGQFGREKLIDHVTTFRSQACDLLMSPADVQEFAARTEMQPGRLHDLALAHGRIAKAQAAHGFHDFASMGLAAVTRLAADDNLRARTRECFDHLLVDEFQDTNYGQFRLIQLLSPHNGNVCVVGDANQAIYSFRGGQSRFMNEFTEHFSGTVNFVLGTNYRSGPRILDAANALIAHNPEGSQVVLRARDTAPPGTVTVTPTANPALEAAHIVRSILELVRRPENPVRFTDIAILYRSVDRSQDPITRALAMHGIPFRSGDDTTGNAETIQNVLAALRLIAGPQRWNDAARLVARNGSERAFALRDIEQRVSNPDSQGLLLVPDVSHAYGFSTPGQIALGECQKLAAQCRQYHEFEPADALYKAMLLTESIDQSTDRATAATLRSFLEQATGIADAGGTLQDLCSLLESGYGHVPWRQRVSGEGITILTVHSAKGLEWPVVFLPAMTDGDFPLPMRLDQAFDADSLRDWANRVAEPPSEFERRRQFLQEERRLAYVALTRAQQEMHISYPIRTMEGGLTRPSQFIAEAGLAPGEQPLSEKAMSHPPASMRELAGQLRTQRNRALDSALDDETVVGNLAALLLDQAAAKRGIAGATPLRPRALPRPFSPDTSLRLSYSQIDLYQDCPRKYFYERALRLKETDEPAAFAFGTIIHAALKQVNETWQRTGNIPDANVIEAAIEAAWPPNGFAHVTQTQQLRQRASAMLRRYFDWERMRPIPRRPSSIESGFSVSWGQHRFTGRIDAKLEGDDGSVEIVDFKASKQRSDSVRKPAESLQLLIYDHAHRQEHPDHSPRVSFLALRHKDDSAFVTGEAWDEKQVTSHVHTDESRAALTATIDAAIEGIASNDFTPSPSYSTCKGCAFTWLCPAAATTE